MVFASSAPRLLLGAPLAALVTLGLVMLMRALITQPPAEIPVRAPAPDIDFLADKPETPVEGRTRPVAPEHVEAPEFIVIRPHAGEKGDGPPPAGPDRPEVRPERPTAGAMFLARGPQRIYTPTPQFPTTARSDEGSCLVRFDIDTNGSTGNIEVVSCTESAFTRPAITAVSGTIYQPAYGENGPVETTGVSLEIVFQLEDAR